MHLSIIIVSYNTADLLQACLSSLEAAGGKEGVEVFVVDNASGDGSAAMVRRQFPEVHLIENTENAGFGAANNQALAHCRGDIFLFLNPDTRIMPHTLEKAMIYLRHHPRIGLAGAHMLNPDGTRQESVSFRYPGEKYSRGEVSSLPGPIACVLGAAMFARRTVIETVGGFDEAFFLYGEDEDLCLRIRRAGWEIGYIEDADVLHVGGQSERTTLSAEKWRKKVRAEYFFYTRHYRPETVARIRRADRLKARWRLLTLGLVLPFLRDKARAGEKQGRYRVILEETRRS